MKHVLIIGEAGVNHNGSIEMAKQLIDAAAIAGVDYVKFQTFKAEKLVTKDAKQAEYQQRNAKDDSQYAMLKKLELSEAEHEELIAYCNEKGVKFLSTAFDMESVEYLHSLNLGLWKIPSGEITNYPYLKAIAQYGEPVILSTGMCEMEDVQNAVDVLCKYGLKKEQITVLHCNTEYPTPMKDVNLKAMQEIKNAIEVKVGYSDHTQGIEVPIAAVALGAEVIEKHFTLDRTLPGPDHKASLEPNELKVMVDAIRNIEQALGNGKKHVSESERKNMAIARKSIVAARDIKQGEMLTEENICVKRPGNGISPMRWEEVIGTCAKRDFKEDELIEL
jgi:N,N'-diacetyllegionaminate synthase